MAEKEPDNKPQGGVPTGPPREPPADMVQDVIRGSGAPNENPRPSKERRDR